MTSISLPTAPALPLWRLARSMGLILTIALIAALVRWPTATLHVLWDMVIPLLPAVFLVNPVIWRNVCPLATLNATSGSSWGAPPIGRRWSIAAWTVGIVLLFTMVPARRFLFNTNGLALAITIAVVAVLALGAGTLFARRSAFCNGLCPVLPVEKLYGQYPLVPLGTSRCAECSVCSPSACIELAQGKTVAQTLGPSRKGRGWLLTPFGVFAAAFPGFIVGYFATTNGALATAPAVYARVLLSAALSYAIVAAIVTLFRATSARVLPILGGVSIALYYWYAAPSLAAAYGGHHRAAMAIQVVMLALTAVWLWRALSVKTARVPSDGAATAAAFGSEGIH